MRYDLVNVEDMLGRCGPSQPHSGPGKGDDVPCTNCGAVALDTGLECTECGHDNYEAVMGKPFGV
jgi:hypothetical protein